MQIDSKPTDYVDDIKILRNFELLETVSPIYSNGVLNNLIIPFPI